MVANKKSIKKGQAPRMRNVLFLAWRDNDNSIQTLQWRVPVGDMVYEPARTGREFSMVEELIHGAFDDALNHYRETGKIHEEVYEYLDLYVAAPELGGTRPTIYQVHVYDRRQEGIRLD